MSCISNDKSVDPDRLVCLKTPNFIEWLSIIWLGNKEGTATTVGFGKTRGRRGGKEESKTHCRVSDSVLWSR